MPGCLFMESEPKIRYSFLLTLNVTLRLHLKINKKQVKKHKKAMAEINFYNIDCIEFMKNKPDNYYDLAVVMSKYFCIFISN